LSSDEVNSNYPSQEKETLLTAALCALIYDEIPSIELFHNLTVSSLEADAIKVPCGENAMS